MLGETPSLYHGQVLELRTAEGWELSVRRRGSTAPGEFFLRRKRDGFYVEFRYFTRGGGHPKRIYIGPVVLMHPPERQS